MYETKIRYLENSTIRRNVLQGGVRQNRKKLFLQEEKNNNEGFSDSRNRFSFKHLFAMATLLVVEIVLTVSVNQSRPGRGSISDSAIAVVKPRDGAVREMTGRTSPFPCADAGFSVAEIR